MPDEKSETKQPDKDAPGEEMQAASIPTSLVKFLPWLIAGLAIWCAAILLLAQQVIVGKDQPGFGQQRTELNSLLRETLFAIGVDPESRSVYESRERFVQEGQTWQVLNWRIRVTEDFDISYAKTRLQAVLNSFNREQIIKWNPQDQDIPLVVEASVSGRLSHRLIFAITREREPSIRLNTSNFLDRRWQLLTGARLDLDEELRQILHRMDLNGPPLLIREYQQSDEPPSTDQGDIIHWVINVSENSGTSGLLSNLALEISAQGYAVNQGVSGEPNSGPVLDVMTDGIVSHRISFSSFHDARGLNAKTWSRENTVVLAPPRVALIIDDLGYDREVVEKLRQLPVAITLSILPHRPYSVEIAILANQYKIETILHLPMEPATYPDDDPGTGAILLRLTPHEIALRTAEDIEAVPYVSGVNNHMGSRAMLDSGLLENVLGVIREKGLYFIDSKTVSGTKGFAVSRRFNVPSSIRAVFIDGDGVEDVDYCIGQLRKVIRLAKEQGSAVAIGHPYETTIEALQIMAGEFAKQGVEVVFASYIVS